jgi:hypothetical protein
MGVLFLFTASEAKVDFVRDVQRLANLVPIIRHMTAMANHSTQRAHAALRLMIAALILRRSPL